jgi:double-stranded uracil-DNA glycosylase
MEHVIHPIPPVFDGRSETLILGSFPSVASRAGSFFYHHPQNRFWRVLAAVLGEDVPESIGEKTALLLRHRIALWDTIASCDITGSSDASIRDAVPNDLTVITAHAPIRRVFCNGALSGRLYDKFGLPQTGLPAARLPSTSPANASWSLPRLIEAWQVIAE